MSKLKNLNRFIVLTSPRTGSTLLRTMISQHPQIAARGELLNLAAHSMKQVKKILDDPERFVRRKLKRRVTDDSRAIGYKVFYEHGRLDTLTSDWLNRFMADAHPAQQARHQELLALLEQRGDWQDVEARMHRFWDSLQEDKGLRVVHLIRRNQAQTYLSLKRAFQTDLWNTSKPVSEPPPLVLDPIDMQQALEAQERLARETLERFTHHQILELAYEDFVTDLDGTMDTLFAFLGVEPKNVPPTRVRLTHRPLSESIENFDDVRRHFAGSPWEHCFDGA